VGDPRLLELDQRAFEEAVVKSVFFGAMCFYAGYLTSVFANLLGAKMITWSEQEQTLIRATVD